MSITILVNAVSSLDKCNSFILYFFLNEYLVEIKLFYRFAVLYQCKMVLQLMFLCTSSIICLKFIIAAFKCNSYRFIIKLHILYCVIA